MKNVNETQSGRLSFYLFLWRDRDRTMQHFTEVEFV